MGSNFTIFFILNYNGFEYASWYKVFLEQWVFKELAVCFTTEAHHWTLSQPISHFSIPVPLICFQCPNISGYLKWFLPMSFTIHDLFPPCLSSIFCPSSDLGKELFLIMYRVICKPLRDFRPLRYSSWDGHAEGEHVNRGRDTPSFCPTLQVLNMSTLGDAADVNPVIKFLPHAATSGSR
jgi:hypothetical protein